MKSRDTLQENQMVAEVVDRANGSARLPKPGTQWHEVRCGLLPTLPAKRLDTPTVPFVLAPPMINRELLALC